MTYGEVVSSCRKYVATHLSSQWPFIISLNDHQIVDELSIWKWNVWKIFKGHVYIHKNPNAVLYEKKYIYLWVIQEVLDR